MVLDSVPRTHDDLQTPQIYKDIQFITFSGVSAAGKNFLASQLQSLYPNMNLIRSFTTRVLRKNQDHEYRHVDREEFLELIENGEFLWHTNPETSNQDLYGTLRCDIDEALEQPWPSVIHVTPQTVHHLRDHTEARGRVFSIYVDVEDEDLLRKRLEKREPDQDDLYYEKRIQGCRNWKKFAGSSGRFNLCLNNDNTKRSLVEIMSEILDNLTRPIGLPISF